jgi:hypothetical protein
MTDLVIILSSFESFSLRQTSAKFRELPGELFLYLHDLGNLMPVPTSKSSLQRLFLTVFSVVL